MTHYVIGFLRRDVSGRAWWRDHAGIHALAEERGWSVMLVYFGDTAGPVAVINQLMNLAYGRFVQEVVVPGLGHFEGGELAALVKIAGVVCGDTGLRYSTGDHGGFAVVDEAAN